MTAPQIEGIVGARHAAGELVMVVGPTQAGRSRVINRLLKSLPRPATFSRHTWPWCNINVVRRELRDGLFVFVESPEGVSDLPIKPYKLFHVGQGRKAA